MRAFGAPEVNSMRSVLAFTVMAHVLDLITTQWRDPSLSHEGNPFYQLALRLGYEGWPWLVSAKVITVAALALGYWWYLGVRSYYLPDRIVNSPRALIWFGMWDRKPYPRSLSGRLFNRRKLAFLAVVLSGLSLPGSAAAALFISLDNACVAMGQAIPINLARVFLLGSVSIVAVWWYWAYWHYYKTQVRAGAIEPSAIS